MMAMPAIAMNLRWDVSVVSWPDGKLLRTRELLVPPPYRKTGPGPGVGARPVERLEGVLDHRAIVGNLEVPGIGNIVAKVALSSDSKLFAAVNYDVLTVWDVDSGESKLLDLTNGVKFLQRFAPPV